MLGHIRSKISYFCWRNERVLFATFKSIWQTVVNLIACLVLMVIAYRAVLFGAPLATSTAGKTIAELTVAEGLGLVVGFWMMTFAVRYVFDLVWWEYDGNLEGLNNAIE